MATMHPADVEHFHTPGEERVYRWLAAVGKPDSEFHVWYNPAAQDREPDFLLFHDSVGLIVLEVKDWVTGQIVHADQYCFHLEIRGRTESHPNPLRQAREHMSAVMDMIKADGRLLSTDPAHKGHPKFPLEYGVVFTNITRKEFVEAGQGLNPGGLRLGSVIPLDRAFFFDDLDPASPLYSTPPGAAFAADLARRFPPRFPFTLTGKEKAFLGGVLDPQVRVRLPRREGGTAEYQAEVERLRALDHNQQAIALSLDGGHRLIAGPSGSGKTLVLVHRAAHLLKCDPHVKRVLFVCYNITLVKYVRRLLGGLGTPLGPDGVEVLCFFDLCAKILGERVEHEKQEPDYYDVVVEETLARLDAAATEETGATPRYDAILVDEGQDLSDDMVRVIARLLAPGSGRLTIALDESQDIYHRRTASWKELGVQAQGRRSGLRATYRNSREITALAAKFASGAPGASAAASKPSDTPPAQLALDNVYAPSGPEPELRRLKSFADVLASLGPQVRKWQDECGYPLSEFAVLYPMHFYHGDTEIDLPRSIQNALDSAGVLCRWASEDSRSKRDYDIATDSVTISTVHSVKGLDYACVFLVGFDFVEPTPYWSEGHLASMMYVAVTRARTRLYVPFVREGWAIRRMRG
jgi:hypothetical protein